MSFPGAISAGNITKCRGDWRGEQYLSLVPNTIVLKATIASVLSANGSTYALTLNAAISGSYGAVKADQRVLIGTADNIRLATIKNGRVRKVMAGSSFYLNETSLTITSGMYLWVVDDYVLTDRLSRENLGAQFKDYEIAYRGLPPVVTGLQSAYAGPVTGTPARYTVAFAASAYAAESGATIVSYQYVTPDGTVTAGALNTATVTIAFPEGFRWAHLTVTDSGGRTTTRHIQVHACGNTYTPALDFTGAQIGHTIDNGMSINLSAWDGVNTILDGVSCVGWTREYYGETEGPITSNIVFVGRLRQTSAQAKSDLVYSSIQEVQYQLESVTAQLARLESLPRAIIPAAAPTVWDEIKDLTVWRAIVYLLAEHSTFLSLYDLTFDDTGTTFLIPQVGMQKGDLYRAITDLASSINAGWEFAPSSETRIVRDLRYGSITIRNAATTVYSFTNADWIDLNIVIDPPITAAKVDGSGATYSGGVETPVLAMAPGAAPLEGAEEIPFTRQYLTAGLTKISAQGEIGQRSADRLAMELNKVRIDATFPDNYHWMVPTLGSWYTFTILATDNKLGLTFDTSTRWLCISVSCAFDHATGTCGPVQASFTIETAGAGWIAVDPPTQTELDLNLPDIPMFDPYAEIFPMLPDLPFADTAVATDEPPTTGATVKRDGSTLILVDPTNGHVYVTLNGLALSPTFVDITPDLALGETLAPVVFDPHSVGAPNAFLLSGDGADSWIWDCADVFAGAPAKTEGAPADGTFQVVRASSVADKILMYSPNSGGSMWTHTFHFDVDMQGWSFLVSGGYTWGARDGNGLNAADAVNIYAYRQLNAYISFPSSTITKIKATTSYYERGLSTNSVYWGCQRDTSGGPWIFSQTVMPSNGSNTLDEWIGSVTTDYLQILLNVSTDPGGTSYAGSGYITTLEISGTGVDPFGGSSVTGASVRVSDDRGATWGSALDIVSGGGPGVVGGFDVQPAGGNSLAAGNHGVYRATTLGGSYASYYTTWLGATQIAGIAIPYRAWDGSDNTAATDPDAGIALTAPDSGGRSLLWLEGGAASPSVVHDLTPTAGMTFDNPDCLTMLYQHHIACFGKVGGVDHLYTTNNRGVTWVDRGALTSPTWLRCRRGDNAAAVSGTNRGQLFLLANGVLRYSPDWGVTWKTKTPPGSCQKADVWG